jgi:hypothetical protein
MCIPNGFQGRVDAVLSCLLWILAALVNDWISLVAYEYVPLLDPVTGVMKLTGNPG